MNFNGGLTKLGLSFKKNGPNVSSCNTIYMWIEPDTKKGSMKFDIKTKLYIQAISNFPYRLFDVGICTIQKQAVTL